METQSSTAAATPNDGGGGGGGVVVGDDIAALKETRQQLEDRIAARRLAQRDLISSLQPLVPDLVSSLDLFLRLISAINRRPFVPTPSPVPAHRPHADCGSVTPRRRALPDSHAPLPRTRARLSSAEDARAPQRPGGGRPAGGGEVGGGCDRLAMVRTMVAVCLLERVPFTAIDSAALLRKLEGDQSSATPAEKAALNELGGEDGTISAVERALPSLTEVWTWRSSW